MAKDNSAVEMVLPPGVFMTTTPRSVAASTSTLSMPTPARPTTRRLGAASITLRVTLVSERTTSATASLTTGSNSASDNRFGNTTTSNSGRCCRSAMPFGETGSQTRIFIKSGESREWLTAGQTLLRGYKSYKVTKLQSYKVTWVAKVRGVIGNQSRYNIIGW